MELIEKAIAKAKRERGDTRPTTPEPAAGRAEPAAESAQQVQETQISKIAYSRTRKVGSALEHWERNRLVGGDRNNRVADLFRILRTKVLQPMREHGWRTLGVVGPTAGVGKSTIAANLAMSIALDGNQTVMLVDLDLRRPRMAHYFGIEPQQGLGDILEGNARVEDVLMNPGVERLVLLPSSGSRPNSSELIGSARMGDLFAEIRDRYESRIVVYDMPPLLASSDAIAFLPLFDAVLLVVEDGASTNSQLVQCKQMLGSSNLVGWVLNKGRVAEHGYYY
jgi:protein-tyrosine kinase